MVISIKVGRRFDPAVGDGFVVGTTRPVWKGTGNAANNVGCIPGVSRATVASVTQSPGATFNDLNITGQVVITASNQTFHNCRFTYSYSGNSGGGMVDCQGTATGTVFDRCEFEPATPGDRYNGIYGSDFTARRTVITKTVDGIGIYNPNDSVADVLVEGCWIGYLAWFNDDGYAASRANSHSDGSHNDGTQHGSGVNVTYRGNFFQGAKYNATNPGNCVLDPDGVGYTLATGNGVDELIAAPINTSNKTAGVAQIYLAQHSAYFHVGNISFTDNWCWNIGNAGFKVISNRAASVSPEGSSGFSAITDVEFKRNIFGGTARDYGGTYKYYPGRFDTNITVNGNSGRSVGAYADTDGNVWDAAAAVASPGTAIYLRYDAPA